MPALNGSWWHICRTQRTARCRDPFATAIFWPARADQGPAADSTQFASAIFQGDETVVLAIPERTTAERPPFPPQEVQNSAMKALPRRPPFFSDAACTQASHAAVTYPPNRLVKGVQNPDVRACTTFAAPRLLNESLFRTNSPSTSCYKTDFLRCRLVTSSA